VDDDQVQLSSFLIEGGAPIPRPATLRDVLGCAPTDSEMAEALFGAVRAYEDATAREIALDAALSERANALRAHYLDDGWTWRR
jgi:hypothetical protein